MLSRLDEMLREMADILVEAGRGSRWREIGKMAGYAGAAAYIAGPKAVSIASEIGKGYITPREQPFEKKRFEQSQIMKMKQQEKFAKTAGDSAIKMVNKAAAELLAADAPKEVRTTLAREQVVQAKPVYPAAKSSNQLAIIKNKQANRFSNGFGIKDARDQGFTVFRIIDGRAVHTPEVKKRIVEHPPGSQEQLDVLTNLAATDHIIGGGLEFIKLGVVGTRTAEQYKPKEGLGSLAQSLANSLARMKNEYEISIKSGTRWNPKEWSNYLKSQEAMLSAVEAASQGRIQGKKALKNMRTAGTPAEVIAAFEKELEAATPEQEKHPVQVSVIQSMKKGMLSKKIVHEILAAGSRIKEFASSKGLAAQTAADFHNMTLIMAAVLVAAKFVAAYNARLRASGESKGLKKGRAKADEQRKRGEEKEEAPAETTSPATRAIIIGSSARELKRRARR